MKEIKWAVGVDLGGTKIKIVQVNISGTIGEQLLCPTNVQGGHKAIEEDIVSTIQKLTQIVGNQPCGVGVGVAGQIDSKTGIVKFAPNLKWSNIPLQSKLMKALTLPVIVVNDVRAATWGEWLYGAGHGKSDLLCIFVGTGIGGGIVIDNKMVTGFNNTAGEIGHTTVSLKGPKCTCGNYGCIEAYAGGWALAARAIETIQREEDLGESLIRKAGEIDRIQGIHVMEAAREGDPLALRIRDEATEALAAGVASFINSLSPQLIIFGGGVIEGAPDMVEAIKKKAKNRALHAAFDQVDIVRAKFHNDAGAIGAGALAMRMFS